MKKNKQHARHLKLHRSRMSVGCRAQSTQPDCEDESRRRRSTTHVHAGLLLKFRFREGGLGGPAMQLQLKQKSGVIQYVARACAQAYVTKCLRGAAMQFQLHRWQMTEVRCPSDVIRRRSLLGMEHDIEHRSPATTPTPTPRAGGPGLRVRKLRTLRIGAQVPGQDALG